MKRLTAMLAALCLSGAALAQRLPPDKATPAQCRQAAEEMIRAGESAIAHGGRADRVERRRRLVADWKRRLAEGEDPCEVYADTYRASTTF